MKQKHNWLYGAAMALLAVPAGADPVPSTIDTPTPVAAPSQVLSLLNVQVDQKTSEITFVNTNNDPYVYTRVYKLKYADPYEIRPYLMAAVRSRRVDTNQTKVEAIKYVDGTGMLIVSAEQYRFDSVPNGMSIDELIETLDQPKLASEAGRKFFVYYPKYFDAESLRKLISEVGTVHELDSTELTGGIDTVKADQALNALMFYCAPSSEKVIREILAAYDAPATEALISYTIYEITEENDGNLGVDFQAWKNGLGSDLFAAGASYLSGWPIDAANVVKDAHANFINFNPRWNSKFLDFLVAKSKAKVVTSGTMSIMNRTTGSASSVTRFPILEDATEEVAGNQVETQTVKVDGDTTVTTTSTAVTPDSTRKNPAIRSGADAEFGFYLSVTPEVNLKATLLNVEMVNTSLLGFKSDGSPRTGESSLRTSVMISNEGGTFYIGGLEKSDVVRSVNKVPYLGDLPGLGWLFSAESEIHKKNRLVAVMTVLPADPELKVPAALQEEAGAVKEKLSTFGIHNRFVDANDYGFDQYGFDRKIGE